MEENGDSGDNADVLTRQVRSTNGQAVGKVVCYVRSKIEVASDFNRICNFNSGK